MAYVVTHPGGEEETMGEDDILRLCRAHGLSSAILFQVAYGNGRTHRGFSCRPANQTREAWDREQKKGYKKGKNPWVLWVVTTPEGEQVTLRNLGRFCDDRKINKMCMYQVATGRLKHHRGYTCTKDNTKYGSS